MFLLFIINNCSDRNYTLMSTVYENEKYRVIQKNLTISKISYSVTNYHMNIYYAPNSRDAHILLLGRCKHFRHLRAPGFIVETQMLIFFGITLYNLIAPYV